MKSPPNFLPGLGPSAQKFPTLVDLPAAAAPVVVQGVPAAIVDARGIAADDVVPAAAAVQSVLAAIAAHFQPVSAAEAEACAGQAKEDAAAPIRYKDLRALMLRNAERIERTQLDLVEGGQLAEPDPWQMRELRMYESTARLLDRLSTDGGLQRRMKELADNERGDD